MLYIYIENGVSSNTIFFLYSGKPRAQQSGRLYVDILYKYQTKVSRYFNYHESADFQRQSHCELVSKFVSNSTRVRLKSRKDKKTRIFMDYKRITKAGYMKRCLHEKMPCQLSLASYFYTQAKAVLLFIAMMSVGGRARHHVRSFAQLDPGAGGGRGGGGGTLLYTLYRYVPPDRVGFLRCSVLR